MSDKKIEMHASIAISPQEDEATHSQYLTAEEIERLAFIDSTIIDSLGANNIFSAIMTVDKIRDKLIEIVKSVEYEDLTKKRLAGYWQSTGGKLVLDQRYQGRLNYKSAREVAIHELLHALTTRTIYNTTTNEYERCCGVKKNWGFGKESGRGFNEGITEYLAQKLCPTYNYKYDSGLASFNIFGTYVMEQIAIKQIAILYGEDKVIDAYLNNHDIDMPQEQYLELRTNFDYINEKNTRIREIYEGRNYEELSETEKNEIARIQNNVENTFIDSQQYFLEKCLMEEINSIATLEQAETMKEKLKELNSLEINIKCNEKANYQKYNFAFIRKYLQIVNQDKKHDEQVTFDEVEKYLNEVEKVDSHVSKGNEYNTENMPNSGMNEENPGYKGEDRTSDNEEQTWPTNEKNDLEIKKPTALDIINNNLLNKIEELYAAENHRVLNAIGAFFIGSIQDVVEDIKDNSIISNVVNRMIDTFNKGKKAIQSLKTGGFIPVDRSKEGKIYIKEVGEETIANSKISVYEILTEEQYEKYRAGDKSVKGEILRGNIDFEKLKKDKNYEYSVCHNLLAKERIEDKVLNYNGYIGSIDENNKENVITDVQERLEETEKYIKLKLDGYEQDMYITEIQNKGNEGMRDLKRYIILTKEEVEKRRREGISFEPSISVQGTIDLEKLETDRKYREVLEKKLLTKDSIEEKCEHFQGYVGEIASNGYEYYKAEKPKLLERFADRGANGEEKRVDKSNEKVWYLKKGKKTGEKDKNGDDLYEYEFITSDEMQKMWEDKEYKNSANREKLVIQASEKAINDEGITYTSFAMSMCTGGGCMFAKDTKINYIMVKNELIWENNGVVYLSKTDNLKFLETKTRIIGNLDIERYNRDEKYQNFILNNVLTGQNIEDIFSGDRNSIEIIENDGEFSYRISKKNEKERQVTNNRESQGIDR